MTRGIVVATIVLALLTGLVVGALGRIGVLAPDSVPAFQSRNQQIGLDYFDAVDLLMRTGDSREVRLLLSADFQDHDPASGTVGDAESLLADYQSLRNVFPGSRYAVTELASSGTLIVASITIHGSDSGEFAGIGVDLDQPSDQQEILRVRDGLIVERWADANPRPQLLTVATTGKISFAGVPELRRWHFEPHAVDTFRAGSEMVLIIDQGTLRVELVQIAGEPSRHVRLLPASANGVETQNLAGTQTVRNGDVLIVPGGSELQLRNYSADHASLLSIAATASQDDGPATWARADSIDRELLARGFSLGETGAGHAVYVGRATVTPGSVFTHQGIRGGGEFVMATDGMVTTEAVDGLVWTVDSASITTANDQQRLAPGKGAAIDSASEVLFEAAGTQPATFWVVTFVPIEQPVTS